MKIKMSSDVNEYSRTIYSEMMKVIAMYTGYQISIMSLYNKLECYLHTLLILALNHFTIILFNNSLSM